MALKCTWGGYADTDLRFSDFFAADHTVATRFMLQFPNAYAGPMLSVNGSGTYFVGQGDYLQAPQQTKLAVKVGSSQLVVPTPLAAGTWHHLALVRQGSKATLYLDGQAKGSLVIGASAGPSGVLRMGKESFQEELDGGGTQFYGMLDDVAVFTAALTPAEVARLAQSLHLTGTEANLLAGYTFGHAPPAGSPATLKRPLTRTPAAMLGAVSEDRDSASDANLLPLALTSHMHVPFPVGQPVYVIQGFDDPGGSHKGYAAFCWDFMHAGVPQQVSDGVPFTAAAPGDVTFVKEDDKSGGDANFVSVRQADHEFGDYLHLKQNTALVDPGDRIFDGQRVAHVGDTGANRGAFHLHLAVTNLSEAGKNDGGAFVTIPTPLSNYDVSVDQGVSWQRVIRGIPKQGEWVRRPPSPGPVRYTAVWHQSTQGEVQVYGQSYEAYRAKYDELWKQGWRLKVLEVHVVAGQVRYTAAWHPSTEGEVQVYGQTYESYRAKYDELWKQGWRLKLLSVYVVDGEVRYSAAWRPSTEGEVQVYGWSYQDYRVKYDELWKQGWRLKLLQVYVVGNEPRYTAVWRPSTEGEVQVYGWSYDDYRAKYDELWKQGWRLKLLEVYVVGGQARYTAVWRPSTEGEVQVYGWSYEDYRAKYDVLWHYGWRLKELAVYAV